MKTPNKKYPSFFDISYELCYKVKQICVINPKENVTSNSYSCASTRKTEILLQQIQQNS